MNEKTVKRISAMLLTVSIMLAAFSGCNSGKTKEIKKACGYSQYGEDITESIGDGDTVLLEKNGYCLSVNGSGVFKVKSGENGRVLWSSAIAEDTQVFEEETAVSAAQLNYQSDSYIDLSANTYADSVLKQQCRYYKSGETVICEMIVGDFSSQVLLPQAIEKSRFEKYISKMDEAEAGFILRQYTKYSPEQAALTENKEILDRVPALKKKTFYVLMDNSGEARKNRIQSAFEKAGYNAEELAADNEESGVNSADGDKVFKIVIELSLNNDGFTVNVPCKEIYAPNSLPLINLDLFKYASYTAFNRDGYYMLPSGSGALFEFTRDKDVNYSLRYSGKDYTADENSTEDCDESGYPIYGVSTEKSTYLAIIEEGASNVKMRLENVNNGYILYPQVQITDYQLSSLGVNSKFNIYDTATYEGDIKIKFVLDMGGNSYSDMANTYRRYLTDNNAFADCSFGENIPLLLDIYNSLYTSKSFAGISYYTEETAATFQKTKDIINDFKSTGISNLHVRLNGANKNGAFVQPPGIYKLSSKAGGKKKYAELKNYCMENGVGLYPTVNFAFVCGDTPLNGYNPSKHTVRLLNKKILEIPYKEKSTGASRTDLFGTDVVSPTMYAYYAEQYVRLQPLLGDGISVGELTRTLNSDFSDEHHSNRADTQKSVTKSLGILSRKYKILGENASVFTLPYVSLIEKLPFENKGYSFFEKDIPFLQMVLHGNIPYTTACLNGTENITYSLLKAIETGSGICYRFADNVPREAIESEYSFLYNVDYDLNKEKAVESYRYVNKALKGLQSKNIISHEYVLPKVVKVTYENGEVIYINYSEDDVVTDGLTVKSMSYKRIGK